MDEVKKDIFMLVDGSAIVHRAYHAMPPFTTSFGAPTGAISGFFSMFLKLVQQLKPHHIVIAFDRPVPTFRQQLYVGYQAQRPKMESDLSDQFGGIIKILDSAKIKQIGIDGFEADDVIGTLAKRANGETVDNGRSKIGKEDRKSKVDHLSSSIVYIVTGDRDILQLVNDKTLVLMPVKGISEVKIFGEEDVRVKYGVEPKQIVDLKSLTGDPSDNYPGVPGIGPKTAQTLIEKYGNFENIYKHIDEIAVAKKSVADKLVNGAEEGQISNTLAKIVLDVPLSCDFDDCLTSKIDIEAFKKGLEEYEFNTLPKRVDEVFTRKEETKKANQMKLL